MRGLAARRLHDDVGDLPSEASAQAAAVAAIRPPVRAPSLITATMSASVAMCRLSEMANFIGFAQRLASLRRRLSTLQNSAHSARISSMTTVPVHSTISAVPMRIPSAGIAASFSIRDPLR